MSDPQTPAPAAAPDAREPERPSLKTDLRWASVLLVVLVLAAPVLLHYFGASFGFGLPPGYNQWESKPAGAEDLDRMTTDIFSTRGLVAPFEILSVLLLAALIAGVVIALRDPEREA